MGIEVRKQRQQLLSLIIFPLFVYYSRGEASNQPTIVKDPVSFRPSAAALRVRTGGDNCWRPKDKRGEDKGLAIAVRGVGKVIQSKGNQSEIP